MSPSRLPVARGCTRLMLAAELIVEAPFRIGSGEWSPLADLPILRDQAGEILIEGTSLAGALRGFLLREARWLTIGSLSGEEAVNNLFGTAPTVDSQLGRASRVRVQSVRLKAGVGTAIRDHVGLDRHRGAAREQVKFDAEVVAAGQPLTLHLCVEDPTAADRVLLGLIERGIREGRIAIGSRTGTGLGRLALYERVGWILSEVDFGDKEVLKAFLRREEPVWVPAQGGSQAKIESSAGSTTRVTFSERSPEHFYEVPNRLFLTYRVAVRDFLLVKDGLRDRFSLADLGVEERTGESGKTVDHSPYLEPRTSRPSVRVTSATLDPTKAQTLGLGDIVLPGSGVRGALRSRAEKILRTLGLGTSMTVPRDVEQRKMAACDVLERDPASPYASCSARIDHRLKSHELDADSPDYYGAVYSDVCLACRLFGYSHLKGRLMVEDLRPVEGGDVVMKLLDHVAIDRFTGGAASQKKFSAFAIASGVFEGRLRLEGVEPWQLGLLALLFKDFWLEDLPLGSGGTRGYGRVRAWPVNVVLGCVPLAWDPVFKAIGEVAKAGKVSGPAWDTATAAPWVRVGWGLKDPKAIPWDGVVPPAGGGEVFLPYLEGFVANLIHTINAFSVPDTMLAEGGTDAANREER